MEKFINKKTVLLGAVIILLGALLLYPRQPDYKISDIDADGVTNGILIEYTHKNYRIKTSIGEGFRSTSVYDEQLGEFDMYQSEKSDKFDLDSEEYNLDKLLKELENFRKEDKFLGHYRMDSGVVTDTPFEW